jgi:hypothetical protein
MKPTYRTKGKPLAGPYRSTTPPLRGKDVNEGRKGLLIPTTEPNSNIKSRVVINAEGRGTTDEPKGTTDEPTEARENPEKV